MNQPQLIHYDVSIPAKQQPKCPKCGHWMHIRISSNVREWACLSSDCVGVSPIADKHLSAILTDNPNL
jgi:ribosomal protein L37AE/L43A